MSFDDPEIRRLSKIVLGVMVLVMLLISCYCALISIEYLILNNRRGNDEDGLAKLMDYIPIVHETKISNLASLVAVLVTAVPFMVAPVCFYTEMVGGKSIRRLTKFGTWMLYSLLGILIVSVGAYLAIDPPVWNAAEAHSLNLVQLVLLLDVSHNIIRICTFFLATLVGLKSVT